MVKGGVICSWVTIALSVLALLAFIAAMVIAVMGETA